MSADSIGHRFETSAFDARAGRAALSLGREIGLQHRLVVPRESMRGLAGARLGLEAGASLDFHDYREYQPGDDLRHLDWGVYARSDREIVKLYREEVSPTLEIVLDDSRSMALPGTPKAEAALALAAAFAVAADNARCAYAVWSAGARVAPLDGAAGPPDAWAPPAFDSPVPPADEILRAPPRWRRNGIRVFISDLLWPSAPEPLLQRLAGGAAALNVVQLLAAEEESPDLRGQHRFIDVESGEALDVFVDDSAAAAYRRALASHRELWSRACRRCGATFVSLTAETLLAERRLAALERAGVMEGA